MAPPGKIEAGAVVILVSDSHESSPEDLDRGSKALGTMLEAKNLVKRYRRRTVVDRVSIRVDPGRVVGLLGPNGAGKTTCFHMIAGLVSCDEGSIRLDNDDLTELPTHLRARKGLVYLPQEPSIFRHLDVAGNVRAALELRDDLRGSGRRREELDRLLDELQISHLADQAAPTLSGGERRRVEIARALAARPRYMLLDEPFAAVDPISVAEIRNIVRHLTDRDIGVLVTDHNVREALVMCDEAIIVHEGRIMAQGTPDSILEDQEVRSVYLGDEFSY